MQGWIKLHRKLSEWEWYTDSKMVHLFIHLLINANHKDSSWQGIKVKRGSLITGRKKLSAQTGISEQSIRTCLEHLKSTNEVTIKSTNKNSIITLLNYDLYQIPEKDQPAKQPTTNQQLTTNNNDKNNKENKNIPPVEEFIAHALEKKPNVDVEAVKLKYEAWKENDWVNGNGDKIKNWKSSLNNTLPYMKEKQKPKSKNTSSGLWQ